MTNFFCFLVLSLAAFLGVIWGGRIWLLALTAILTYFRGEKILSAVFWAGLFLDFLLMSHLGVWTLINLAVALLIIIVKQGLEGKRGSNRLELPE